MSQAITVAADDFAIVRVFQLSDRLARRVDFGPDLTPLTQALGLAALNPDHVQVASIRGLDELGLAGLLEQGHGVAPATLAPDAQRLAAIEGTVAILRSRAFGGTAQTLQPGEDCTLIATYAEAGAPPPRLEPLHNAGAAGVLDGQRAEIEQDHRASRRTLLIGLVVALGLALIVLVLGRVTA